MGSTPSEELLLSNRDAASYIGVTPQMLRLSRHTGEIFKGVACPPFLKMGKAVRYLKSDLTNFVTLQRKYRNTADYSQSNKDDVIDKIPRLTDEKTSSNT